MTLKEKQAYTNQLLLNTKCAVLIVDVQNDYCHQDGACSKSGKDVQSANSIITPLKKLTNIAHKNNIPIIYIRTIHEKFTDSEVWSRRMNGTSDAICRRDTWGAEFYKLTPSASDIVVEKHRYSAFIGTELTIVLRALKIETLLLAGVSTNICVESTVRDGYMLDYNILLFEDCCAAFDEQEHNMALQNIESYFGTVTSVKNLEKTYKEDSTVLLKTVQTIPARKREKITKR